MQKVPKGVKINHLFWEDIFSRLSNIQKESKMGRKR